MQKQKKQRSYEGITVMHNNNSKEIGVKGVGLWHGMSILMIVVNTRWEGNRKWVLDALSAEEQCVITFIIMPSTDEFYLHLLCETLLYNRLLIYIERI